MNYETPFTDIFKENDPAEMEWEVRFRKTIYERFGLDSKKELPDWLKEDLPSEGLSAIEDEFGYGIIFKDVMRFSFIQRISDSAPMSNEQYLFFHFGIASKPDNPGSALIDPAFATKKFVLEVNKYSNGETYAQAQYQNLDMVSDKRWNDSELSDKGKTFVNDVLINEPNIRQIRGMSPEDLELLVNTLKKVREKFFRNQINVHSWHYT